MQPLIRARNIRKQFGNLEVLKGIDCDVMPGKVTVIVGPSGAGKTTLLQVIGTLLEAEKGASVEYNGKDVLTLSDNALSDFRNANIGFVFQFHQLLPEFSLLENVAMPALIGGAGRKDAMAKASELLQRLGLSDRASHLPSELSGGECQRAAVARALINDPKVILADEPSGSLDSENRRALHDLFFELRDRLAMTFLIVTHDETLAARADRVIRLRDGRIDGSSPA